MLSALWCGNAKLKPSSGSDKPMLRALDVRLGGFKV